MPEETPISSSSLNSPRAFPESVGGLDSGAPGVSDRRPGNDVTVEEAFSGVDGMFDQIAAGLYSMASMLVGEGEDGIRVMEQAVTTADISGSSNAGEALHLSRRALAIAAIELMASRDSESLAAPVGLEHAVTCIEDDDLDAAGEAKEALERMIAGPDRERVRNWLESLPTGLRTVYVLRAVGELNATETAELLASHGGPQAQDWNPEAVRELFRQGLCSLASQLIHATAGR